MGLHCDWPWLAPRSGRCVSVCVGRCGCVWRGGLASCRSVLCACSIVSCHSGHAVVCWFRRVASRCLVARGASDFYRVVFRGSERRAVSDHCGPAFSRDGDNGTKAHHTHTKHTTHIQEAEEHTCDALPAQHTTHSSSARLRAVVDVTATVGRILRRPRGRRECGEGEGEDTRDHADEVSSVTTPSGGPVASDRQHTALPHCPDGAEWHAESRRHTPRTQTRTANIRIHPSESRPITVGATQCACVAAGARGADPLPGTQPHWRHDLTRRERSHSPPHTGACV